MQEKENKKGTDKKCIKNKKSGILGIVITVVILLLLVFFTNMILENYPILKCIFHFSYANSNGLTYLKN